MTMLDHLAARPLLDQARRLVGHDSDAAIDQVDLRRAVSNAYYAVFHDLSLRTAAQIVGHAPSAIDPPPDSALHVTRWITHRALREACRSVTVLERTEADASWTRARRSAWHLLHADDPGPPTDRLLDVARRIERLQELRHIADYDQTVVFFRPQVVDVLADAADVIDLVQHHRIRLRIAASSCS